MSRADDELARWVGESAEPLRATRTLDRLIERAGDAKYVLIGEASHGTHSFYRLRAGLTKRLIAEKGFAAVAIEGDWPDSYRVNRYLHGLSSDGDASEALRGFRRFPAWMWRNADVLDFVGWLREENDKQGKKIGFYGLDLYSLNASIEAVLAYLDRVDPIAAERARYRYACFEAFGEDPQTYGYAASFGLGHDCEKAVIDELVELSRRRQELLEPDGLAAEDAFFETEQNARVVKNAEEYYRAMFRGRVSSWNLRDRHMADTLDALVRHLERTRGAAKVVVWAHNSHVGDARATEMGDDGELNIGQLVRERHPGESFSIGMTTHSGTVTAASNWDAPAKRKTVRPALPGSYEDVFHRTGIEAFLLMLRDRPHEGLATPRLERAIGVIYRPETERVSHYFHARLADQFDAVIHLDRTRAVEPLEARTKRQRNELPETYPSGI